MIKLDSIDKSIIIEHSSNYRTSSKDIAIRINSKEYIVQQRLKKLNKQNLFINHMPIINYSKMSIRIYRCRISIKEIDSQTKKSLRSFLKNYKLVINLRECIGICDYTFTLLTKSIETIEIFQNQLSKTLEKSKYTITIDESHKTYNSNYLDKESPHPKKIKYLYKNTYALNTNEEAIINYLLNNPLALNKHIAVQTGLNLKTVREILRRLIKKEILLGFNAKINYKILGYEQTKVLLNSTSLAKKEQNIKILCNIPEITFIQTFIGSTEIEINILSLNIPELQNSLNILKNLLNIGGEDIRIYFETKEIPSKQSISFSS